MDDESGVVCVDGVGEACAVAELVKRYLDTISYQRCQVLIVAHRIELIDQIGEHLRGYGIGYGVIAGGRKTKKAESVMVASIQTLSSKLSTLG